MMLFPRLSDTALREIDELVAIVGARYAGWCWNGGGTVCVDVLAHDGTVTRYPGENVRKALAKARQEIRRAGDRRVAAHEHPVHVDEVALVRMRHGPS